MTPAAVVRLAFLLLLLLLSGCGERQGAVQTAPGEPRIVALSPALGIMVRDLGLERNVVARHGWDYVLDPAIPVAGDQADIDYEALITSRPTHILIEWGDRPLPDRLQSLAERNRWQVHDFTLLTLDDITQAARKLEETFEEREPLSSKLEAAFAQREADRFAASGKILLLMSLDPPAAMGPGSAHQQLLERIGGTPAITDGRPHMILDAETTASLAPDGVIIFSPRKVGEPRRASPSFPELQRRLGRIGLLEIPAMERGHIAIIDHPLGMSPSSSLAEIGAEMERILAEWSGASHPLEGGDPQQP